MPNYKAKKRTKIPKRTIFNYFSQIYLRIHLRVLFATYHRHSPTFEGFLSSALTEKGLHYFQTFISQQAGLNLRLGMKGFIGAC